MAQTDRTALVAVGSNASSDTGDTRETVVKSKTWLEDALGGTPVRASRLYRTPAFPAGSGPDFVNAAFSFVTDLSAAALLDLLHGIEARAGRVRERRWGQRTLDLDLLAIGDEVHPDAPTQRAWVHLPLDQQMQAAPDQLILPHPRLQDRSFVLVPLAEIAADWRHPVLDVTVAEMLAARDVAERAEVRALQ